MLELLKNSCSRCIEATALFMDELASVLKKGCLDRKVEVSVKIKGAWVSRSRLVSEKSAWIARSRSVSK